MSSNPSSLLDPGAIAHQVVDALLPEYEPSPHQPRSTTTTTTATGATRSAPTMRPSSAGSDLLRLAAESAARLQSTNLCDDDLMKAVRAGKIPTDVTDSQAGMMALQARMDHISEMNKMMTSMMEATPQMKMGVIDNLPRRRGCGR
jgi:hypothetical protein